MSLPTIGTQCVATSDAMQSNRPYSSISTTKEEEPKAKEHYVLFKDFYAHCNLQSEAQMTQ